MDAPRYPSLYQINTRPWLNRLSREQGQEVATLDDIPDAALDRVADGGFDWVWFRSVWQTGEAGRRVSREHPAWRGEFAATLPDLREEDISGSGFAISGYVVHRALGGDEALARLRWRLQDRGLRLMLDFVPNHTALDHPWVEAHPEYYIGGTEVNLAREPQNYTRRPCEGENRLFAYGRDPYFSGWPDTLQLNYGNPATQEAMLGELLKIAGQCDGVRCDMAMLVLPEVFERTWGIGSEPFWPRVIPCVRERVPDFRFMAEVYWDLEWTLQRQGFDWAYDKRLYDRLRERHARPVREHFWAGLDYQDRLSRFLENHDEPRAAATFPPGVHEAAAVITYLAPGLRFFQEGQFEGRTVRISPHLCRDPDEPINARLKAFYDRLLAVLRDPAVREGRWRLLDRVPAWNGNETFNDFLTFSWQGSEGEGEGEEVPLLVAVNYAAHQSQCYMRLPFPALDGHSWRLVDQLGTAVYDRDGGDLLRRGLYLDMGAWAYHAFRLEAIE